MKSSNWHGGKGSTPRTNTHSKQYQDNWDKIFGKDKKVKDDFSDRARPDGLIWERDKIKNDGPPMPNGLQRAWERKDKK